MKKNHKTNTIRIAIDGNEANTNQRVGSNVYAFSLLKSFEKLARNKQSFKGQKKELEITVLLSDKPGNHLPEKRTNWKYKVLSPAKFWTQWALPLHLFLHKSQYDVFFTPGHYAPRFSSVPYVSSVMDLAFLEYPEQFKLSDQLKLKSWTEYSVKKAAKVITISDFTKQKIHQYYNKSLQNIIVAHPAVNQETTPLLVSRRRSFLRKHKIKKPFILYVGTLQPRKNLVNLVEAFEKLSRSFAGRRQPLQLVIAGKIGWLADDILKRIKLSPFRKKIILTGFIDDQYKEYLYKQARCSVLVGLYEGFGMPALESLSFGTIPVVSKTTSLPEVVGRAGITVTPESIPSITRGLKRAVGMTAYQKGRFRKLAKDQITKFSWDNSAKVVLETLLKVAHDS